MKCWGKHHAHNLGPISFARCGGVMYYEWECCRCGKKSRSQYQYSSNWAIAVNVKPKFRDTEAWDRLGR